MQLNYSKQMAVGILGSKLDSRVDHTETRNALESLPVGAVAVRRRGTDRGAMLPRRNKAVTTFSADFVASNVIVATVNGVALAGVTFSTNQSTTVIAVCNALLANANVKSAVGDPVARTITIVSTDGAPLTLDFTITLGASQATDTTVYSCDFNLDVDGGIVLHSHTLGFGDNLAYKSTDAVSFLRMGGAYVTSETAISPDDLVYVRVAGEDVANGKRIGNIRKDADSGNAVLWTKAQTTFTIAGAGLVGLKINAM